MIQEQNSLETELTELKEKFDVLTPDIEIMRRADKIMNEIGKRCLQKEVGTFPSSVEFNDFTLSIAGPHDEATGFEHLSDEELKKELQNCKSEIYPEQISQVSSPVLVSVEEKISAIKEKWKPVHDFDAQRSDPKLYKEEQKKSNTVIHSGTMHKDGKRIASFLRSKT